MNWSEIDSWARYILLLKWPYAGEAYLVALISTSCVNSRGGKERYEGPLLLGFLNMLIATVGSGALAPMILRDPLPFFNDDRLITLVLLFFLFAIRFDPYIVRIIKTPFIWKAMNLLSTVSRLSKIAYMVDYATNKLKPGPYYPVAICGPILAGFARGIGGSLLPADKGLSCLKAGIPWKFQMSFFVAVFYHIVANDSYVVGGMLRGALGLGDASKEDIRFVAVVAGTIITIIQLYFVPNFNPFSRAHKAMYAVTGFEPVAVAPKPRVVNGATAPAAPAVPVAAAAPISGNNGEGAAGKEREGQDEQKNEQETPDGSKKATREGGEATQDESDDGAQALYDLRSRRRTQFLIDAMKPVAVVAVAILAMYSQQPPSLLKPGDFIAVGDPGLASCAFLPSPLRVGYCDPLRAAITAEGSLVIYRGDGKAVPSVTEWDEPSVEDGEVLFSTPIPRWRRFEVDQLRVELTNDALLVVMSGPKKLWSSTLTPLGKRLPPYRVEARLDAVKGALEVYKGGFLQWSSAQA